ncbi:hypothetical protein MPER_08104 [Moniliophthora perniciosa FA553]|nr:hypothetical protein MPER_08104 [Moniliophthora perniciosa FA553]
MQLYATLLSSFLLSCGIAAAAPLEARQACGEVTLDQLNTIINGTSCANSNFPDECRDAAQALPFVNKAFADYDITTTGEKAALLSLMSFETGGFAFNINHFPGPAQQALDLAGPDPNDPSITDDTKNAVRELVLGDDLSFASAAWFYKESGEAKTGCTANADVVQGLQAETLDGWTVYIEKCIGTTVTPDRQAGWEAALNALKA